MIPILPGSNVSRRFRVRRLRSKTKSFTSTSRKSNIQPSKTLNIPLWITSAWRVSRMWYRRITFSLSVTIQPTARTAELSAPSPLAMWSARRTKYIGLLAAEGQSNKISAQRRDLFFGLFFGLLHFAGHGDKPDRHNIFPFQITLFVLCDQDQI